MAIWNPFQRKKKPEPQAPAPPQTAEADDAVDVDAMADAVEQLVAASPSTEESSGPISTDQTKSISASEPAEKKGAQPEKSKKKLGIFGRFKQAVKKTVAVLNTDIRDLVGVEGRLVDEEFLNELFAHLIKTDMGVAAATKIRDAVGSEHRARKVTMQQLVHSAKRAILEIMEQESADLTMAAAGPTVIMVVGVNGSGKTTSIAKLAHRFRAQGKKVVLGAGDTFRAAAVEQLTIWAGRIGADIVTGGKDPASVAYKAVDFAKNNNCEICIVDTAGRLQTQRNLMDELTKIRNVIAKVIPEAPHEVLLVLDATAGQNALSQAKGFSDAAGCTGIVLAKLDGTAKGGVAIPIRQEFGLPVKFIGLGETPDAFEQFDVGMFVDALFDIER
ncbi:MAG TPA: signal recognition particle-docking protein FtsY [Pirellulaceae bacterium]|mgnify:CR=1 FL=1|nr:signal recognition particle-docking protein FtsY [Pirellulaceae bacterium]HMO92346.1 signal recognition particle-docking protein FtsY [Pirellulaceae bacterium]HMP69270.1 signal recognition particle-docking protein FtsY [Pirellulaceae bacterium]